MNYIIKVSKKGEKKETINFHDSRLLFKISLKETINLPAFLFDKIISIVIYFHIFNKAEWTDAIKGLWNVHTLTL